MLRNGLCIPKKYRSEVWVVLLGVVGRSEDKRTTEINGETRDNALENSMLEAAEVDLVNQGELRSECAEASTWAMRALEDSDAGGSEERLEASESRAHAISADMDLLLTFFSKITGPCHRHASTSNIGHKSERRYAPGVAYLVAPFYAAGLSQTTTIYKCLRALCSAFLPASVAAGMASSVHNCLWHDLGLHGFGLLLRYHDPELADHMSLCSGRRSIIPKEWLYRGFVSLSTSGGDGPVPSTLLRIWDWVIIEANPIAPWLLAIAMLKSKREIILKDFPHVRSKSIASQKANAQRMADDDSHTFKEEMLGTKSGISRRFLNYLQVHKILAPKHH